jgi:hypothetical protein
MRWQLMPSTRVQRLYLRVNKPSTMRRPPDSIMAETSSLMGVSMSSFSRRGVLGITAGAGLAAFGIPTSPAHAECGSIPSTHDPNVIKIVYQVGVRHGVTDRVMLAGFEAGWVESRMNNLPCGDSDSLGVFQQRPSQGWGTPEQILNVDYAATQFFVRAIPIASANPGYSAGQVAQAVQRSAFPSRYDEAQSKALQLIEEARVLAGPVQPPAPPPQRLGNAGGPAVSWAIGRVDVFGRGGGGAIYHNFYQRGMEGGSFPGWNSLAASGGSLSRPVAVSHYNGRLDVFAYNPNRRLAHWWFDRLEGNRWMGPYERGTTTFTGHPTAVCYDPGRVDLFSRDTNNRLRHAFYTTTGENVFHPWEELAGGAILAGDPTAVQWHTARWDVFAVGTDNRMKHWFYDRLGDSRWHGPETLGTNQFQPTSTPAAVSWAPGRIDLFARDTANRLLHTYTDTHTGIRWPAWETLATSITSAPTAVSQYNGRLDIFATTTDQHLHQWHFDRLGDSTWHHTTMADTTFTNHPGTHKPIAWAPGRLDLFAIDTNNTMRHRWYDHPNGWTPTWQHLNGQFQ